MTDFEHRHALQQGHEIAASDSYFEARPQIDSNDRRKVFQAGFERGWDRHAALVEAQQPACDTARFCQSVQRCTAKDETRAQQQAPGAPNSADELARDLKKAIDTATELREQLRLMEEHARNEVWRWQADGADDLATMGNRMAVLIYASDLRDLIAAAPQPLAAAQTPVAYAAFADNGNIRLWSRNQILHPDAQPLYVHPSPKPAAAAIGGAMNALPHEKACVDYALQYGGRCRDCADENGVCPTSGLPCCGARKAVTHVVKALRYGLHHGYLRAALAEVNQ